MKKILMSKKFRKAAVIGLALTLSVMSYAIAFADNGQANTREKGTQGQAGSMVGMSIQNQQDKAGNTGNINTQNQMSIISGKNSQGQVKQEQTGENQNGMQMTQQPQEPEQQPQKIEQQQPQEPEQQSQESEQQPQGMVKQEKVSQDMDTEREDMTPPENPETEPGEDVPEKPETEVNEQVTNQPKDDISEPPADKDPIDRKETAPKADESLSLVNMKAVEAYIEDAGDGVNADVKSAYEALSEALTADPDEEGEDAIYALESTLNEALENAEIDLEEYAEEDADIQTPEKPNDDESEGADSEIDEEDVSAFQEFLSKYWDQLVEFFKGFFK